MVIQRPSTRVSMVLCWLLLHLFAILTVDSFSTKFSPATNPGFARRLKGALFGKFSVPAEDLEASLFEEEKTVVQMVRNSGPSVAYVASVWPTKGKTASSDVQLPYGQGLGTGSGFVIDSRGYLVTNYHVIERAYRLQQMRTVLGRGLPPFGSCLVNATLNSTQRPSPEVFARINSKTNYLKCRIVDVRPELDLAILKIDAPTEANFVPVSFGSSTDLLVGQSLVAIGNPFGLDNSVTKGVVSALGRDLKTRSNDGVVAPVIRNCIQTDCSINPGNSGGPLLNLRGEVVGVNTAILSTSGSSAGIGLAVPSAQVAPETVRIIRRDAALNSNQTLARLGVKIARSSLTNRNGSSRQNWVASVEPDSPADEADIKPLMIFSNATVQYGDCIVNVGGTNVPDFESLESDMDKRRQREKVAVTLENYDGDRRIVYVTLDSRIGESSEGN